MNQISLLKKYFATVAISYQDSKVDFNPTRLASDKIMRSQSLSKIDEELAIIRSVLDRHDHLNGERITALRNLLENLEEKRKKK